MLLDNKVDINVGRIWRTPNQVSSYPPAGPVS